jgi:hypothetical protein
VRAGRGVELTAFEVKASLGKWVHVCPSRAPTPERHAHAPVSKLRALHPPGPPVQLETKTLKATYFASTPASGGVFQS